MEDVIWFLVNYPVFLLLVMNICAYWKRDRVTEALAKVIDSRKRIKIDIVDIVCTRVLYLPQTSATVRHNPLHSEIFLPHQRFS